MIEHVFFKLGAVVISVASVAGPATKNEVSVQDDGNGWRRGSKGRGLNC